MLARLQHRNIGEFRRILGRRTPHRRFYSRHMTLLALPRIDECRAATARMRRLAGARASGTAWRMQSIARRQVRAIMGGRSMRKLVVTSLRMVRACSGQRRASPRRQHGCRRRPTAKPINLETAKKAAAAAAARVRQAKNGWAMCDRRRRPVRRSRLFRAGWTTAQFASIAISQHKARAAATFRRPTKVFEDRIGDGAPASRLLDARRRHRIRRRHPLDGRRQDRRRDRAAAAAPARRTARPARPASMR